MPRTHHPQPDEPRPTASRRPSRAVLVTAVLALLTGAWLVHDGSRTHRPPTPAATDAVAAGPSATAQPSLKPLSYSVPVRVRIPAIKVDAPVTKLGLDSRGRLQVPPGTDRNLAGWYSDGPAPGTVGAAVLVGHVDTMKGRAVFYNLGSLHKGNTVRVTRADGRTAVFTIYGIEVYSKAGFPSEKVYGDTATPEIRVITCGGGFRKSTGYLGNVVAYARLTAVR